jgi:1-acyl-sn-glycerol-3-phosphate acyltransferase
LRINNWSIPYAFGYVIVAAGVNTFYKRHAVVGIENIPKNKPVIFASNHQNAFLDPVVIAVKLKQPTYYLVRADIFKKPLVAKIFDSINMMPVYRERDGVDTKNANEGTFNRCFEILSKNRPIIIFPEGNHGKFKNLRLLKKGFARIAAGAEEKYGKDIDVQIIPVGINYSDHNNMGAELVINIGKPMDVSEYGDIMNDPRCLSKIKDDLTVEMRKQIIDIKNLDNYTYIHEMMYVFEQDLLKEANIASRHLSEKYKIHKSFIEKAENYIKENPSEERENSMKSFSEKVNKMGLRYWLFNKEKHASILSILILIIFFPFHIYGVINNYLPYILPVWFVKNKIKDVQFHSSLKMALGVLFFFLFWIAQTLIIGNQLPEGWQWIYGLSLPISAWISYQYWIKLLKTQGMIRYNKLRKTKDNTFMELVTQRETFKKEFEAITRD